MVLFVVVVELIEAGKPVCELLFYRGCVAEVNGVMGRLMNRNAVHYFKGMIVILLLIN